MGETDRQMWIAAVACCAALIGLAFAPWVEARGQEFDGTGLPLMLGISRGELLIAAATAMAAISLVAIRRPDLQRLSAPVLSIVALGAFMLCASTVLADWRLNGCGFLSGVHNEGTCPIGALWAVAPTLPVWAATGLSALLTLWFSAYWFRLQRRSSNVSEVSNGWA